MSEATLACFKAYDIRGRVPDELNEDLAAKVGRAFCGRLGAKKVVVGRDVRLSSESSTSMAYNTRLSSGWANSSTKVSTVDRSATFSRTSLGTTPCCSIDLRNAAR